MPYVRLAIYGALISCPAMLHAAEFYVAPAGSDSNNGSINSPFATFTKAQSVMNPGDTLFVRGGTYQIATQITLNKAGGSAALPLKIFSYADETPVLDFATQPSNTSLRGIFLESNYWEIKGLTVQNARDNGIIVTSSNNTIERVVTRYNGDSGVQISSSNGRIPSNNLVLNTDSYSNYDPTNNGENADGFAIKFRDLGPGNVVRGVRAWGNSDDGFDFWVAENGVTVENSWSFKNGFNTFGDTNFQGDGNGIKLGHDSGTHVLKNMLVWGNRANGVDVNGNATQLEVPNDPITHGVQVYNVTSYANGSANFRFDESFAHVLRDNLSLSGGSSNVMNAGIVHDHNSWNGAAFTATAADFLSLSDAGMTGPRLSDGSLPELPFLRLVAGSNLIDSGVDVDTAFYGAGADLGAFEWMIPGDVNKDGRINTLDFNILSSHYGMSASAAWRHGSFDFDGDVDSTDFNAMVANFGTIVPGSAPFPGAAVPEPVSSAFVMIAGAALLSRRRQRE